MDPLLRRKVLASFVLLASLLVALVLAGYALLLASYGGQNWHLAAGTLAIGVLLLGAAASRSLWKGRTSRLWSMLLGLSAIVSIAFSAYNWTDFDWTEGFLFTLSAIVLGGGAYTLWRRTP